MRLKALKAGASLGRRPRKGMDEFDLIARLLRPLAIHAGAHNLQDDGASLPLLKPGQEWRVTTDTLIADVHFRATDPLDGVAWRALATNVSDLVAQLATPRFYFLNLSIPDGLDLPTSAEGLPEAQAAFGLSWMGGDTTRTSGPLTLSITALGVGQHGDNPLRSRAQLGDQVGLLCAPHGPLGAAKAGFEGREGFEAAYLRPQPCLAALPVLQGAGLHAMADVSDGLLQDLGHIARASGLGARVDVAALPLALPDAPAVPQITWGDDYALVMTAAQLPQAPGLLPIGHMVSQPGVKLLDGQGAEIPVATPGYVHRSGL